MAGEFVHADVGGELTEAEYHSLVAHVLDGQVRGDLIVSNSAATGLTRLAIGAEDSLLVAAADDPQWSTLRWSGSDLGPSADADLLGLAAGVLTVRGQADIEGYAVVGNGSALNAQRTLIVSRTFNGTDSIAGLLVQDDVAVTGASADIHLSTFNSAVVLNDGGPNVHGIVSQLRVREPQITETVGTVTAAANLYIEGDATEGDQNYGIYMPNAALGVSDGAGTSGEQLTSGGASAAMNWAASSSLREYKTDIVERTDPGGSLALMVGATVFDFRYPEPQYETVEYVDDDGEQRTRQVRTNRTPSTGDFETTYVGVMGDEAPWAMHHGGRIFNPISFAGRTVEAFQEVVRRLEAGGL